MSVATESVFLDVRVQPRASRSSIEVQDGGVLVRVTAAPENGRANDAVVALLAKRLGIAKRRVRLVRGHRGRDKRLLIEGMTMADVLTLLSGDGRPHRSVSKSM